MGLPNIKKNSDSFEISSEAGKGTRLKITINLASSQAAGVGENSIRTESEKCRGCMYCLRSCPTRAIRIREKQPAILDHLCIDCANCIDVCESDALAINELSDDIKADKNSTIILPSAVAAQFGASIGINDLMKLINEIGFGKILFLEQWDNALRIAVIDHARHEAKRLPVISPTCPAAINLIRTRFPGLVENVAPFYPSLYAAAQSMGSQNAFYVILCPSHKTILSSNGLLNNAKAILPALLRKSIMPLLKGKYQQDNKHQLMGDVSQPDTQKVLRVTGVRHVMKMMEAIEDGQIDDTAVVEMYLCDHGCLGSPLLNENAFVAEYRLRQMQFPDELEAKAVKRTNGLTVRQGMRLDKDMAKAIEKLKQISEHIRTLPGRDCGICGSPNCAAMAEDIVLGRAKKTECVFFKE